MSIREFNIIFPGMNDSVKPRFGHLHTTDTLATVSAAGYLDPWVKSQGFSILDSDFIFVAASDGHQIYKPVITNGSITLTVLP